MIARMLVALATALTALTVGCAPAAHVRARTVPVAYAEPKSDAITFWGHACAYIDVGGFGIVTDPVFSRKYATIRHRLIASPPSDVFDQTRVIVISHAHQDHLDPATLVRFSPETVILAPWPAAGYLRKHGIRAQVMRPGEEYPFPGGTIIAVPAHHPGGRLSLKARSDGRALGYVIRTSRATIYYTGDTRYFPGFATVAADYQPDVVLLNLNAHLHSRDAFLAIEDLDASTVVPMHLGAYDGKSERLGPRWRSELVESLRAQIVPLEVGQSLALAGDARDTRIDSGSTNRPAPVEARGISRFVEIEPGLARGGQPTSEGLEFLRERGYRTVISFRRNSRERRALEGMGIRYVQIPLRAGLFGAAPPSREDVARFLSVVSDSSQRPVFIHCRRGKDRTGAMAAIYRIEACGWSNEDAVREMLSFGFDRRYRKLMNYVRAYTRETAGAPAGP
jgi:L-ascorbate metabolism protein UlaG (beta-lactamase superfamily)/protein tyrosine phosphatase (PTP) superfamily phosphohydrolase (DUF442 family)